MTNTERLERIVVNSTQAKIDSRRTMRSSAEQRKYNIHVAMRLLQYIEEKPRMNQTKLAKQLGISSAFLSRIVNGKENLSLDIVAEYERRLGNYPLLKDSENIPSAIKMFAADNYSASNMNVLTVDFYYQEYGANYVFA